MMRLESAGWTEHYYGPRTALRDGAIAFAWTGRDWAWAYAEEKP